MPLVEHLDGLLAARRGARGEAGARQQFVEQIAIGRHVVHDQQLPGGLARVEPRRNRLHDGRRNGAARCGAGLEREREHAPLPRRALDDEVAVHQAREAPADGEAQPGAADADLRVGLVERVEDPREISRLDSRSRVLDGDGDHVPVRRRACAGRGANGDPPALGELDGVAQQVDQHLADLDGVSRERARQARVLLEREAEALVPGQLAEHQPDVVQHLAQIERLHGQRRAAGLDLRHLQDVVDQGQQMSAARVDDVELLFLLVAQVRVAPQELGVAEDRVHRRADLVRHVGEEGALRPAGALRGLLGRAQLGRAARHERFEALLVLAQLQIGDQHLVERLEQRTLFEQERPFGRRGALLEVHHLDQPAAVAGREGHGLLPRRLAPARGRRPRGRHRRCAPRSTPDTARPRASVPRAAPARCG